MLTSLQSVTSTIGRNIETVMAARLVHEGGRLTVLPMPENVDKVSKPMQTQAYTVGNHGWYSDDR
jgi:hypothetical protein